MQTNRNPVNMVSGASGRTIRTGPIMDVLLIGQVVKSLEASVGTLTDRKNTRDDGSPVAIYQGLTVKINVGEL